MSSERLANLFGVAALAATDRLRVATEAEVGGSGPAALVHLQAHPGESIEGLRRVLGIAQPPCVRLVNRLAGEGLLERRAGRDRRTVALYLTHAGRAVATGALRRRASALEGLLGTLSVDEQAALTPLLERLVAALADDRRAALHACRLCDRAACGSEAGCPLDHTVSS